MTYRMFLGGEKTLYVFAAGVGGAFYGTSLAKSLVSLRRTTSVTESADVPMISVPGIEHIVGIPAMWLVTYCFTLVFFDTFSRTRLSAAMGVGAVWHTVSGRVVLRDHYNPRTKVRTTVFRPLYFAYTGKWKDQIERTSTWRRQCNRLTM